MKFPFVMTLIGSAILSLGLAQVQDPSGEASAEFLVERLVDLDQINELGILRVGLPNSRTNFFVEKGDFRGFEFELFREFEKQLNSARKRGELPMTVVFHPMPVAELIPAVNRGLIDVAAGIVITEDRQREVQFTNPYLKDISAVVISNSSVSKLSNLLDLSGKSVLLNRGSSYPDLVKRFSQDLELSHREPVQIELVDNLETEDIFELVNSGAVHWTVAHEHLANLWNSVFDSLHVYSEFKIGEPANFAWAVRKDSTKLLGALNHFISKHRQGTLVGNVLLKRYFKDTRWVSNPLHPKEQARIRPYLAMFKKYGEQYDLDWVGLVATAYQESGFNPKLRSRAGAVGLMQIKPETAAEVGITGIEDPEKNVEAAVRYLDLLRKRYFNDPDLTGAEQQAFVTAAYNAGPNRIRKLRGVAEEQGLDPNRWFGSVELVVLKQVGLEPVRYVANVAKYTLCINKLLESESIRVRELKNLQ